MSWWSRIALIAGAFAAALVGWYVASSAFGDDSSATTVAAAELYSCPTATGATTLGRLAAGDQVWLIGHTGDQWAVIRHPDDPLRLAWIPMAMINTPATAKDLPELRCDEEAATAVATTTTEATVTSVGGSTTTTTLPPTTSSSSTLPPTTVSSDHVPPTVVVTPDRAYLYLATTVAPCSTETEMFVAITVADPTLPVAVRSIIATWSGPAGPKTATLTPAGGNRFRLVIDAPGSVAGETPLTLTATANDGAGNVGTGIAVVSLRDPNSFGCT